MAFITAGNAAPEGRIQLAPHRIFTSLVKMDKYEILNHLFKQNADLEIYCINEKICFSIEKSLNYSKNYKINCNQYKKIKKEINNYKFYIIEIDI